MEQIVKFIEQYWGVTLIGSISVGTIITSIVSIILLLTKMSKYKNVINSVLDVVKSQSTELSKTLEAKMAVEKENEHYKQVESVMFKALSYIIMASKLDINDKISIQNDISALVKDQVSDVVNNITSAVEAEVDQTKVDIKQSTTEVINNVGSLLKKYTKDKKDE